MDAVYLLHKNINRLSYMERGDAFDLKAFDYKGRSDTRDSHLPKPLDLPNPVFFYEYSKRKFIAELDALHSMEAPDVYSERMIEALASVRDFSFRKYPIAILSDIAIKFQDNPDGYKMPDPYAEPEKYKKESIRDDMYIFQTTEVLDVFDWEKSVYKQYDYDKEANIPSSIREFVLKEPAGGFPPLFRLPFKSSNLFVSAEARMALKLAGIKGLAFLSLKGFSPTSQLEIDVPV
jgi:hypothetical protein